MFKECEGSFVVEERAPKGFHSDRRISVQSASKGIILTMQDDQGLLLDMKLDKEGYQDLIDAMWLKLRHSLKVGRLEDQLDAEEKAQSDAKVEQAIEAQDHEPQHDYDIEY
jgi:hypothetical protein